MFAPAARVRVVSEGRVRDEGDYVLHWMTAFRRTGSNFALQHAVAWARLLRRPLLVLEPLRVDHPWASVRFHRFVVDGMVDNARACRRAGVTYYPYLEPEVGAGKGLVRALAERACVIVTDDYPCFFHPRMLQALAGIEVRLEAVDANGLLPVREAGRAYLRAVDFRRFLQHTLAPHLHELPAADPLAALELLPPACVPPEIARRYPAVDPDAVDLSRLPIDQSVGAVETRGGASAAQARLAAFIADGLARYGEERNDPDTNASSVLSPFLHFGHLGAHQVLVGVAERIGWDPSHLGDQARGGRLGFWNMGTGEDAFLDQVVTWRELGLNATVYEPAYATYASVPAWARASLHLHRSDPRPDLYTLEELDEARTHDDLWNAAQRQLRRQGRIHNYLRMLWGKKVLEWSPTPGEAFERLVHLNNRYALDGRDPNSYSGIAWCFGRYDRAWGPERPIFGKVRYMTSESARRKLRVRGYMQRFGPNA